MVGFYRQKWSASARWCERIAILCLPYFVIVILLHRFEEITTPQTFRLIAFGLLMILVSLFLGIRAFFDLWNFGRKGGRATIRGMVISLLLFLPFGWFAYLAVEKPMINDISTNPFAPPPFLTADEFRRHKAGEGINQLTVYDDNYAEQLLAAYPEISSRRYNAGALRIYDVVRGLILKRGWEIIDQAGLPEDPAGGDDSDVDEQSASAVAVASDQPADGVEASIPLDIRIEAVSTSLVFGFPRDIVIQIVSESESTLVDMRSASRWGAHDYGENAAAIDKFLSDLDAALLGIAGEG